MGTECDKLFTRIKRCARKDSASFDTNVVLVGGGANMVLNENPTKKWKRFLDQIADILFSKNPEKYKFSQWDKLNVQLSCAIC